MPAFAHLDQFTTWVRRCNPGFTKSRSSLKKLFAELESDDFKPFLANKHIRELSQPKTERYLDALHYLLHRVPEIPYSALNLGGQPKARAARFPQAALPHGFGNPVAPKDLYRPRTPVTGAPGTLMTVSLNEYLLRTGDDLGIVLIHLGTEVEEMKLEVEGKTAAEHVSHALNIAAIRGHPARSLLLKPSEPAVCALLKPAWDRLTDKARIVREHGHMGTKMQAFTDFVTAHGVCVVMGYDATICVHANLFGAAEYSGDTDSGFRPLTPITALADVVTARTVLMVRGTLHPKTGGNEYGPLTGT